MNTALGEWLRDQDAEKRLHLLRHQPSYFADAGDGERLRDWLTDFGFLAQKLAAVGITALLNDFDLLLSLLVGAEQETLSLIQQALRLSAHVLDQDKTQLAEQLWGRLLSFEQPEIVALLAQAQQAQEKPWFRPLTANLTPPGGPLIRTFRGHSSSVLAVAITPDGKQAVSASSDETLKLWDLEQGRELATLSGHSSEVLAVAIAPDGKQAVSASSDETLKLWDLVEGSELATFRGHSGPILAVAIAPDGKRAVSASYDNTLKLWDLEQGRELATLSGHSRVVRAVAIAPDGKRAVSASSDETLKLWDLEQGRELATLSGHSSVVRAVAIAPDGKRAVSASYDNTLKLWDLEQGRELATLSVLELVSLSEHNDSVTGGVLITPDGKQAVSASDDNTLKLWDLETGTELATLRGHSKWVTAVAITPDGKRAVSASGDTTLKLWDLEMGDVLATFTGDGVMISCTIAPDGVTVMAGDRSGRVHFLRLEGL